MGTGSKNNEADAGKADIRSLGGVRSIDPNARTEVVVVGWGPLDPASLDGI